MTNTDLENEMAEHGIRPTSARIMISKALLSEPRPLSAMDIETKLETVDRSTISRCLSLFMEKGFVHLIEDGSGSSKFELCHSHEDSLHDDLHVHFHCKICRRTLCFPELIIPEITIPDGFKKETASFLISGICPDCRKDISE